jgi:hypothetical protein
MCFVILDTYRFFLTYSPSSFKLHRPNYFPDNKHWEGAKKR